MRDLLMAGALLLVIEGLLYAVLPGPMKRLLAQIQDMPASTLRQGGLITAIVGMVLAYLVRGQL